MLKCSKQVMFFDEVPSFEYQDFFYDIAELNIL